jgi:hypothetical protein
VSIRVEDHDLILGRESTQDIASCWITVGNVSVQIRHTREAAIVALYLREYEMDNDIGFLSVPFDVAQQMIDRRRREEAAA